MQMLNKRILLTCLLSLNFVYLFSLEPDFTAEERAWIRENPVVRIQAHEYWAPFCFLDNGVFSGFHMDILDEIARISGLSFLPVPSESPGEARKQLLNSEIDLLVYAVSSEGSEPWLDFSDTLFHMQSGLYTRKGNPFVSTLEDLKGKRVAGIEDVYYEGVIGSVPDLRYQSYRNPNDCLQALSQDRVDYVFMNANLFDYYTNRLGIENLKTGGSFIIEDLSSNPAAYAALKENSIITGIMNKSLAVFDRDKMGQIENRWLGYSNLSRLDLDEEDRAVLEKYPEWLASSYRYFSPFSMDIDGESVGFTHDLLRLIAGRLGVTVRFTEPELVQPLKEQINRGEIDILTAVHMDREYLGSPHYSIPYIRMPLVFLTHKRHRQLSLDALLQMRIGMLRGAPFFQQIQEVTPEGDIEFYDGRVELVGALRERECDLIVLNMASYDFYRSDPDFRDIRVADSNMEWGVYNEPAFLLKEEWGELLPVFNKALLSISREEMEALRMKWNLNSSAYTPKRSGPVSSGNTLRGIFSGPDDYREKITPRIGYSVGYPYMNRDPGAPGILGEILRDLSGYMDTEYELSGFKTRKAGEDELKNGGIDLFLSPVDGGSSLEATIPMLEVPYHIVQRDLSHSFSDMNSLEGRKVGIYGCPDFSERIMSSNRNISFMHSDDAWDALSLLARGDCDAVIGDLLTMQTLIRMDEFRSLELSSPVPWTLRFALHVADETDIALDELNRIIAFQKNSFSYRLRDEVRRASRNEIEVDGSVQEYRKHYLIAFICYLLGISLLIGGLVRARKKSRTWANIHGRTESLLKASLAFSFILIVFFSLFSFYLTRVTRERILQQNIPLMASAHNTMEQDIEEWMDRRMIFFQDLLEEAGLFAGDGPDTLTALDSETYEFVDPDGIISRSFHEIRQGREHEFFYDRDYIDAISLGKNRLFMPVHSEYSSRIHQSMTFLIPLYDSSGKISSYFMAYEDPSEIFPQLIHNTGYSSESYLVNTEGYFLSEPPGTPFFYHKGILETGSTPQLSLPLRDYGLWDGSPEELPLTYAAWNLMQRQSGMSRESYSNYASVPVIGMWTWNPMYQFGIVTEMDYDYAVSAFDQSKPYLYILIFSSLMVLILSVVLNESLGRYVSKTLLGVNEDLENRVQGRVSLIKGMLQSLPVGVGLITKDGRIDMHNPVLADILKESINDPERKFVNTEGRVLRPEEHPRLKVLEHKKSIRNEVLGVKEDDGSIRWLNMNLNPVYMDNTDYVVFSVQDSTEEIEYEMHLKRAKEAAEDAVRIKSAFLATMSHEIRTPMNSILALAEIMSQNSPGDEMIPYLESMKSSTMNLMNLLNDVLDYSKMEAGRVSLNNSEFSFLKLKDSVNLLFREKARNCNIRLDFFVYREIRGCFSGDFQRITQILVNLIDNSLKFTSRGFVEVRLRGSDRTGYTVLLEVADSGIGISEEDQKKLFSAFVQLDSSISRKYEGSGLGLSIVRELVELMEGEILLESRPGKGSLFRIYLPLEKVSDADSSSDAGAEEEVRPRTPVLKPGKIRYKPTPGEAEQLTEFKEALRNYSSDSVELFNSISPLVSRICPAVMHELEQAMERYDFTAALELLEEDNNV